MRIVFVFCSVACSMACVIASSSMLPRIYPGLRAPRDTRAPTHLRHLDAEHRANDPESKVGYRRRRED